MRRWAHLLVITILISAPVALAQKPVIESISAGAPQLVLAPGGGSINKYGGLNVTSDEHSTVFPPGTVQNSDYLFWVASDAGGNSLGVVVLSGGFGPNSSGQWTLDFARADGYGSYASGFGPVFVPPTGLKCPVVSNATSQDGTFDLSYAAAGSVVPDPTHGPGNLLMIYEGTNTCVGITNSPALSAGGAYITVAVATSNDYGRTWPAYRGTSSFAFAPVPTVNKSAGPNAGMGALGSAVCIGNDCTSPPPATYGRYAVIGPKTSLSSLIAAGKVLPSNLGDGELSAFLDDVGPGNPFVYVVHGYKASTEEPHLPDGRATDLMLARAQLNGGTAPLAFSKWNGQAFASPGLGGDDVAILPDGAYRNCGALSQTRESGAINYADDTQQYLLTFVCDSPTDPATGSGSGVIKGSAWFWATSPTPADPRQWSTPQEISGSWGEYDESGGCPDYQGFYPTLMSLGTRAGHLSKSGYAFYLWGCQGAGTPGGRQYSSRSFTMTIQNANAKRRAAAHR